MQSALKAPSYIYYYIYNNKYIILYVHYFVLIPSVYNIPVNCSFYGHYNSKMKSCTIVKNVSTNNVLSMLINTNILQTHDMTDII